LSLAQCPPFLEGRKKEKKEGRPGKRRGRKKKKKKNCGCLNYCAPPQGPHARGKEGRVGEGGGEEKKKGLCSRFGTNQKQLAHLPKEKKEKKEGRDDRGGEKRRGGGTPIDSNPHFFTVQRKNNRDHGEKKRGEKERKKEGEGQRFPRLICRSEKERGGDLREQKKKKEKREKKKKKRRDGLSTT